MRYVILGAIGALSLMAIIGSCGQTDTIEEKEVKEPKEWDSKDQIEIIHKEGYDIVIYHQPDDKHYSSEADDIELIYVEGEIDYEGSCGERPRNELPKPGEEGYDAMVDDYYQDNPNTDEPIENWDWIKSDSTINNSNI
jgi:hypothetical protein